jgi:O-glycosyl hydrolase
MNNLKKYFTAGFLILLLNFGFQHTLRSQMLAEPFVSYSFSEGMVADDAGNTNLSLRNGAALYEDSQRGQVLRFKAAEKSYAVFDKQVLNRDTFTFAFYFFWEDAGARTWHQLFEIYNWETGSNIFLCSANSWNNQFSFFSDCREYGSYEGIYAQELPKNEWVHLTVTLNNKDCRLYIDGVEAGSNTLMFTPSIVKGDSLFLAGNPYRSDDYYITARYDDINVYYEALAPNQVKALAKGHPIPEAKNNTTSWDATGNPIRLTIDLNDKKQTIRNFGASDGWNTENIGKYWPLEKKEKLAELIFSTEKDASGNPKGIGLSSWRFNIGAGTAEQGDDSRISFESRRTEGFLNSDGTYNWNKQEGQQWFLKKAVQSYNIHHAIGWQNSPPVVYTKNNLGFREYGAPMETILNPEHFDDFARFLADVTEHFSSEGIHFDFISPFNEPQYGWSPSSIGGTVTQEGTPWTNQNIYDVVNAINTEFTNRNIETKIFIGEAGSIKYLLRGTGHAENQLYHFWNSSSDLSLVHLPVFANIVSYHSYWNDYGNVLVDERRELFNRAEELVPVPELWQTEYSMLGTGYRSGYPENYILSEMETALSLARVILADLNIANTAAWQWWTMFEKGKFNGEARYCLIEAFTNQSKTDGVFHPNKLLYALGNFSHFIRPGMIRIGTSRSDGLTEYEETTQVNFSAYTTPGQDKFVLVAVNHTNEARQFSIDLENSGGQTLQNMSFYLTDDFNNLKKQERDFTAGQLIIPAHSVATITGDIGFGTSASFLEEKSDGFKAWYNSISDVVVVEPLNGIGLKSVKLYNISGVKIHSSVNTQNKMRINIPAQKLHDGIYIITGITGSGVLSEKVVVFKSR